MAESLGPHSGIWTPLPSTLGTASPHGPRFRACTPGSACNTWTCLPAASPVHAEQPPGTSTQHFFPSLQHGTSVATGASAVVGEVCVNRSSTFLLLCHLAWTRTRCGGADSTASSSPCYYQRSRTSISNDGKIQGGSLEGSLLRYFLQMLSQLETAVSQYSWSVSRLRWYRGQRSCRQPLLAHPGNVTRCQQMRGNGNTWKYDTIGETYGCNI